ncbi:MAG: deoxyribose-phosphate aldolase [Proteobacteria bacterium]|nr:MAG: deoxyribose-phosphate aldolase [Pseudomonadota bacterium]
MAKIPSAHETAEILEALSSGESGPQDLSWLPALIDHTLLKPGTSEAELTKLCEEAIQHRFATVCVRSENIPLCAKLLQGSGVKPIAVVGFPDGDVPTMDKVSETGRAIAAGAKEIDMVLAKGLLRKRAHAEVFADIKAVVEAAAKAPVKVILETCLLDEEEKLMACALAKAAGASFVKTSTGFSTAGATVEDIQLMRRAVGPNFGVKASGGVRTLEDALRMVQAGATRIGTSNGVGIVGNAPKSAATGVY